MANDVWPLTSTISKSPMAASLRSWPAASTLTVNSKWLLMFGTFALQPIHGACFSIVSSPFTTLSFMPPSAQLGQKATKSADLAIAWMLPRHTKRWLFELPGLAEHSPRVLSVNWTSTDQSSLRTRVMTNGTSRTFWLSLLVTTANARKDESSLIGISKLGTFACKPQMALVFSSGRKLTLTPGPKPQSPDKAGDNSLSGFTSTCASFSPSRKQRM
mmetsp:Transcript_86287/g.249017  ORF Transcript_86287/g.249017 Transcript_86287/m.249017 type:complete len:216 (-) Transcript_86287:506-1153(-)